MGETIMKRIDWIDFGKGLTIFFVVVAHSLSDLLESTHNNNFIFQILLGVILTFVMPCFFALSGFLYRSPKSGSDYLKGLGKKFCGLVIPYGFFSVIYIMLQQFDKSNVNKLYTWGSLLQIWNKPIGELWFLYSLFFIFLVVGLMDVLKIDWRWQLLIYSSMFILVQVVKLPFMIAGTFGWLPCFMIGVILKKHPELLKNRLLFVASLVGMIVSLVLQYLLVSDWYNTDGMLPATSFSKLLSILVFFYLFSHFHVGNFYSYFSKYGQASIVIYLIHVPIKTLLKVLLFRTGLTNYFLLAVILIVGTWFLSIFVCLLANKFKGIRWIFYPRFVRS